MRSLIIRPHLGPHSGHATVALYSMGAYVGMEYFTTHLSARQYAEELRVGVDTMDCRVNDKLPIEGL